MSSGNVALSLHPDRLFAPDPTIRAIARTLYEAVRNLPIISPHGHVPPQWLAEDIPFSDPATLLVTPDHYVTRIMHSAGVDLAELGVGQEPLTPEQSRRSWRLLCEHWPLYRGTPMRYWMESELVDIFGVTEPLSAQSADRVYDQIAARLASEDFKPRALFRRFNIEILATTDDPCDDLRYHRQLMDDPEWSYRVMPTYRPDRYLEPAREDWNALVDQLGEAAGVEVGDYDGYLQAHRERRRHFIEHGAVSADHSHTDVVTLVLDHSEAARIYAAARAGTATAEECLALRRHLLVEMARMSVDDGLVMTLHPAVYRNQSPQTLERFGADRGADIPTAVEWTNALAPLLGEVGLAKGLHIVLITMDETGYSREIAPMAGFWPSVFVGPAWWFIDAPDAIRRFRAAVTEASGFSRYSGFIDDTRAFCSIPARHDMARRLDCDYLARLVAEHRLTEDEAVRTAVEMVADQPRKVFKL